MAKAKPKTIELRLLNKLTGEVNTYEINPNDPDALATAEEEAKAFIEEIDRFRVKVKGMVDEYMAKNDYKPVEVLGGKYQWVHRAPVRTTFSFPTARDLFDEDMLISRGVVTLQSGKLKELLTEMVADGTAPEGAWDRLMETAETKATKPFVMLERLK